MHLNINQLKNKTAIHVTRESDFDNLMVWKRNHDNIYNSYTPVLNEGVIYTWSGLNIYFKEEGDGTVTYATYNNSNSKLLVSFYRDGIKHYVSANNLQSQEQFSIDTYTKSVVSLHAALMEYMAANVTVRKRMKKSVESCLTMITSSTTNKSRYTSIRRIRYDVNIEAQPTGRKNQRLKEGWEVQGFWRHFRDASGEVVSKTWVREHTRGDKAKAQPQQYRL